MTSLSHIKDGNNHYHVVIDNESFVFDLTHQHATGLKECINVGDGEEFIRLFNTGYIIEDWSEGNFRFQDGRLYYENEEIHRILTNRIIEMIKEGFDHAPMLQFAANLYENPSNRAVLEAYPWLAHRGIALSSDGHILGHKGVKIYRGDNITDKMGRTIKDGDFVDKYTGKSFRNNPGDLNWMKRRQVDDNCTNPCSNGLHVGTQKYANGWAGASGKVVIVKFDPANIVSIPTDSNCEKLRCWKYEVVAVCDQPLPLVVDDAEEEEWDFEEEQDICDNCGQYLDNCECESMGA